MRPMIAFLLRGTKFIDPIDGKSFRMFLPYGYEKVRKSRKAQKEKERAEQKERDEVKRKLRQVVQPSREYNPFDFCY